MTDRGWLLRVFRTPAARWAAGFGLGALALGTTATARSSVLTPYRLPSGGMAPTLLTGDHVLASRVAYGLQLPGVGVVAAWGVPDRGDVIVFRYPDDPRYIYVQRVVAVAGDRIAVRDHRVVLNGEEVPWSPAGAVELDSEACAAEPTEVWTETLPSLAGVPRAHQVAVGAGRRDALLADAPEIEVPSGHVFTLGDHRDGSEDGRRWGVLPVENILGRAEQRWFSWDECRQEVRAGRMGTAVHSEGRP